MTSVLRRAAAGAVAGVVGTIAMDVLSYRRQQGDDGPSFREWEFASPSSFEDASAPGEMAQRVTGLAGVELPDRSAALATNVMHWLTGVSYGLTHAMFQHDRGLVAGGLATGLGAFAGSYTTLGAIGIYQPIWEYDRETLQRDLVTHLAFGLATGLAYRLAAGGDDATETDG